MKCLVTGGTGYIGQNLIRELLNQGHTVRALVRQSSPIVLLQSWGVETVVTELTGDEQIRESAQGIDQLYYLAGMTSFWNRHSKDYYQTNYDGFHNVVDIVSLAKVKKIVYVSCYLAIGPSGNTPINENDHHTYQKFSSYYHETKYLAHLEANRYRGAGLPFVSVYPGMVYGPGKQTSGNLFNSFLQNLLNGNKLPLLSPGSQIWNVVYMEDVVRGIIQAAEKGKSGNSYILGGENLSLQEILNQSFQAAGKAPSLTSISPGRAKLWAGLEETLSHLTNTPPRMTRGLIDLFSQNWALDSTKAKQELGYTSRSLVEGLSPTIKWLKENPMPLEQ